MSDSNNIISTVSLENILHDEPLDYSVPLMTDDIEKVIPPLYGQEDKYPNYKSYVRYIGTIGGLQGWVWYVVEYKKEERVCFGFVQGWEDEFGYFSISEFETLNKKYGLPIIQRDVHFKPSSLKKHADF